MSLDPMIREFFRFVFSREGQEIVIEDGYIPVPPEIASEELAKIDSLVKTLRRSECPVYHTTYSVCLVFVGQYIVAL